VLSLQSRPGTAYHREELSHPFFGVRSSYSTTDTLAWHLKCIIRTRFSTMYTILPCVYHNRDMATLSGLLLIWLRRGCKHSAVRKCKHIPSKWNTKLSESGFFSITKLADLWNYVPHGKGSVDDVTATDWKEESLNLSGGLPSIHVSVKS